MVITLAMPKALMIPDPTATPSLLVTDEAEAEADRMTAADAVVVLAEDADAC